MHRSLAILLFSVVGSTSCNAETPPIKMTIKDIGELAITVKPFDTKKNTLKYCGDYACLMSGKPFFGSDGKQPVNVIESITVKFKNASINLNASGMVNPGIDSGNIKDRMSMTHYWGDFYKVSGRFSDGSGTYIAQWIVSKDGSIRTHLSDMETAMDIMAIISPQ